MERKGFPDKYYKLIKDSTFVEEMDSADEATLKASIVSCEGSMYNIEKAKESDEKLNGAKALVKEYSASYREASAFEKAKIQYCLYVMESRGYNTSKE